MFRLMTLAAALLVMVLCLWLASLTSDWMFHHIVPYLQSRWLAPACSVFTALCISLGAIFMARRRRKVEPEERLTPLPPASQRPL
jgi:hypothetical protein